MRVGGSSTDHPVLFVFVSDADDPQLVVKLPSLPVEVADVEREADLLSALNEVPALGVVVPTVADLRLTDDFAVMSQSFVPGVAASQAVNNQNYETIAGSVTAALTQLARATTEPRDEVWVRRLVDESLDRLGQTRETKMLELQRLTRISLEGLKLDTSVCQHRDLGPWNVHLSDTNQVGVIDWGDATMTGVPLCDVLHCLVHLGLILNDAYEATDRRAAVSNVLDPNTTSGVTITGCLHQYCEGLGIDGGQIRRLRILTWLRALVDRPPEQRVGSIYEELLLAELSAGQS
ncbi:MAG: aminoglycoside phosphotransferase family protein [Acidimicrobiales bacterium]|nr:aminoglycoside phosphotransferase family protein [Acidimicrobiales bacterium]